MQNEVHTCVTSTVVFFKASSRPGMAADDVCMNSANVDDILARKFISTITEIGKTITSKQIVSLCIKLNYKIYILESLALIRKCTINQVID